MRTPEEITAEIARKERELGALMDELHGVTRAATWVNGSLESGLRCPWCEAVNQFHYVVRVKSVRPVVDYASALVRLVDDPKLEIMCGEKATLRCDMCDFESDLPEGTSAVLT